MNAHAFLLAVILALPVQAAEPSAPARWYQGAKTWVQGVWNHESAADWLDKIGPALAEQDYQGTLVIVSGASMQTLGVFHAYQNGHERMRLVALTGPRREVIRDDDRVTCIGTGLGPVGYDSDTAGRWNPGGNSREPRGFPVTTRAWAGSSALPIAMPRLLICKRAIPFATATGSGWTSRRHFHCGLP